MCVCVCVWPDAVLIGQTVSGGVHRATHLFQRGTSSTRLCLTQGQGRNNQVCEPDTVGTITLINSSAIRVVEPFLTSITITDDECEQGRAGCSEPGAVCMHAATHSRIQALNDDV